MTEDSKHIIIQAKNARIITILAEKFGGSIDKAVDVFYHSATAQMIQDGVADLVPKQPRKYNLTQFSLHYRRPSLQK